AQLVEEAMADLVDRTHPSLAKLLEDLVFAFDVLVEERQTPPTFPVGSRFPADRILPRIASAARRELQDHLRPHLARDLVACRGLERHLARGGQSGLVEA